MNPQQQKVRPPPKGRGNGAVSHQATSYSSPSPSPPTSISTSTPTPLSNSLTALPNDSYMGQMHDRLVYATAHIIGQRVQVRVANGQIYEGLFHAANTDFEFGVILHLARLINEKDQANHKGDTSSSSSPINELVTLVIPGSEFVHMTASNVDLHLGSQQEVRNTFQTDTGISGFAGDIKGRELEAWVPDEDNSLVPLEYDSSSFKNSKESWDQFDANERLYGVKTTYNEEDYTTKLDRESEYYKRYERTAESKAEEIMRQSSSNIHLAEERGQRVEMENEEDLYSSVIRENPKSKNAPQNNPEGVYVPPHLRNSLGGDSTPTATESEITKSPNLKKTALPPTILKANQPEVPEKVYAEVEKEVQQFSERERQKISQTKQALREEKNAQFKNFSQQLKIRPTLQSQSQASPQNDSPGSKSSEPQVQPQSQSPAQSQVQPPPIQPQLQVQSQAQPPQSKPQPQVQPSPQVQPQSQSPSQSQVNSQPQISTSVSTSSETSKPLPEEKKEGASKLNPFAKEFKFDPSKRFVPAMPKNDFLTPEKRKDVNTGVLKKSFHIVCQENILNKGDNRQEFSPPPKWPTTEVSRATDSYSSGFVPQYIFPTGMRFPGAFVGQPPQLQPLQPPPQQMFPPPAFFPQMPPPYSQPVHNNRYPRDAQPRNILYPVMYVNPPMAPLPASHSPPQHFPHQHQQPPYQQSPPQQHQSSPNTRSSVTPRSPLMYNESSE